MTVVHAMPWGTEGAVVSGVGVGTGVGSGVGSGTGASHASVVVDDVDWALLDSLPAASTAVTATV